MTNEDLVDTGITTDTALRYLPNYQPASLRLCALLDKPARRQVPVKIDYLGSTVEDLFIVGYGIDFDQQYRQLPDIYYLKEENQDEIAEKANYPINQAIAAKD